MLNLNRLSFLLLAGLLVFGCGDDDTPTDGGAGDVAADVADGCTPMACTDIDEGCGMHSDGCGGMLDCGTCGCETDADCPSRPCETVTCDASQCVSAPISCGGEACECIGDDCSDVDLRACGGACGVEVCDPSPMTVAGEVVYQNQCVPNPGVSCGLCDLGVFVCDGDGAVTCEDVRVPLLARPELAECDDTLPESTFLYLDPAFTLPAGETSNGSRTRPYLDLDMAVLAAQSRGAFAIIIGGSPTFTGTLEVTDGIAVFGGFSNAPDFDRDSEAWPVVQAGIVDVVDQRLVALSATDLALATRVEHLRLVTEDLSAGDASGASSAGAFINNSPTFELANMRIEVGAAATGVEGTPGSTPVFTSNSAGTGGAGRSGGCGVDIPFGAGGLNTTCDGLLRGGFNQRGARGAPSGTGQPLDLPDYHSAAGSVVFYVQGSESNDRLVDGGERTQSGGSPNNPATFSSGVGGTGTAGRDASPGGTPPSRVMAAPDGFPNPTVSGTAGGTGSPGAGGAGGSSGMIRNENNSTCQNGGGGGGGGAGGCGGTGGTGGGPGGWTVGVVVGGDTASVVVEGLHITLGAGGVGGVGGAGAPGTAGASGGRGGSGAAVGPSGFLDGGDGGPGGSGGMGGAGGQGSTGRSVGVYSSSPIPGLNAESLTIVDGDIEFCEDGLCCEATEIVCGGACVSPTSNAHCGMCDNDCGEFDFCSSETMMCES